MGPLSGLAARVQVTRIESALDTVSGPRTGRGRPTQPPRRRIDARAAATDARRTRLKARGIDLSGPSRQIRKKTPR